ncbi:MAG: hypothetical protein H0T75_22125 [Rhizobiales bacterium]|nr:hypothetical protein [Hyphomicrobiales bacterium]
MRGRAAANRDTFEGAPADPAVFDYPAVREAFNRVLGRCTDKLTKKDIELGYEVLRVMGEPTESALNLILDASLYSRPGDPFVRTSRKRAIDRLAAKAATKGNRLEQSIATKLPDAFFSVFQVEACGADGCVHVKDLLDEGRQLLIRDNGLAASSSAGTLVAGRFLDLGPWLIGFGIVHTLRRSEAAAIIVAHSYEGEVAEKRDSLHELVHQCRINDVDLVLTAVEPLIFAVALAVDSADGDVSELVAGLGSFTTLAE